MSVSLAISLKYLTHFRFTGRELWASIGKSRTKKIPLNGEAALPEGERRESRCFVQIPYIE